MSARYGKNQWNLEHRDKCREYKRKYYQKHKMEIAEKNKEYRNGIRFGRRIPISIEERRRRDREYDKSRADQKAIREQIRRARKHNCEGSFTKDEWEELCSWYFNRCVACGSTTDLTVDHIVPLSRGGTNYVSNLQPLCKSCNSSKGTKTINYCTGTIVNLTMDDLILELLSIYNE